MKDTAYLTNENSMGVSKAMFLHQYENKNGLNMQWEITKLDEIFVTKQKFKIFYIIHEMFYRSWAESGRTTSENMMTILEISASKFDQFSSPACVGITWYLRILSWFCFLMLSIFCSKTISCSSLLKISSNVKLSTICDRSWASYNGEWTQRGGRRQRCPKIVKVHGGHPDEQAPSDDESHHHTGKVYEMCPHLGCIAWHLWSTIAAN